MTKTQKILIILNLLFIVGIFIYFAFIRKPYARPEVEYVYITDTIRIPEPYPVPKPYLVSTPPITVKEYLIDSSAVDSLKVILTNDSIIISGLKNQISLHQNYLKQYPENPKLLNLDLRRDTLSMGLLRTSGIPEENQWPIDLNRYSYRWDFASSFTRTDVTEPPPTKKWFDPKYYVGGGVDFLYMSPYVSGRIEQEWSRVRLYSSAEIGLLKRESSSLKLGIDCRINAKSNR